MYISTAVAHKKLTENAIFNITIVVQDYWILTTNSNIGLAENFPKNFFKGQDTKFTKDTIVLNENICRIPITTKKNWNIYTSFTYIYLDPGYLKPSKV